MTDSELATENARLRELLEGASSAIQWWCDEFPEMASESDQEFLESVKAVLGEKEK